MDEVLAREFSCRPQFGFCSPPYPREYFVLGIWNNRVTSSNIFIPSTGSQIIL
jgi:hypothetical protein